MLQIGFPRNLLHDKVLYSNQPIGVIVADTLEHATHAAELVHVKYTTEAFNVVLEKALAALSAPSLRVKS